MVGVPVRHKHARERAPAEGGRDRVEVRIGADAGVDERRLGAVDQPGVVAAPGERAGIAGFDEVQ